MRLRGLLIGGIAAVVIVAGVLAQPGASARASGPTARIAVLAPGSWCWFGDPRALALPGTHQTIVGWISPTGAVTVASYDSHLGVVLTRVVGHLYPDDHSSPSLFLEPDGRITVFFSGHNGAAMHYRTTERPDDISTWGPAQDVPSQRFGHRGFTYPNPVSLSGEHNKLYLFVRGEDWSADFITRTATGRWSRVQRLIADHGQRPYVKVDSDGRRTIALAYTNGHPRETLTSLYFAEYHGGALWTAGGQRIRTFAHIPIAPQQGQLVYDGRAKHISAWVWDVALGSSGHPVIVYATFPKPTNHQYWYARWNGSRWVSHLLTDGGPSISPTTIEKQYSGGIALDHHNPSTLYLSRKVDGHFRIERWTTSNGGRTWRSSVVASGSDNVRPVVPRGWTRGRMGLLWLRGPYRSYTTYGTSIAYLR